MTFCEVHEKKESEAKKFYSVFRLPEKKRKQRRKIVGVISDEVPPVPMPNTEVKLISAENTWLETTREDKAMPALSFPP